jgi:hypothetical protein
MRRDAPVNEAIPSLDVIDDVLEIKNFDGMW